jgi:hypothetical protein
MPKIGDVPADDVTIKLAQDFVKDHGFDLTQYGAPEVDHQWKVQYDAVTDKSMAYVPDTVRVVFPLMVDGKPVFDEGGTKSGINVGVNIRQKKVSDAYGIVDQTYLKSAYPAVTDSTLITKYLDSYGDMPAGWTVTDATIKQVDITLGTPEVGFVKTYNYENAVTKELIVPALIFPVTDAPANSYFQSSITVPLAQEMLDKLSQTPNPRPMPLDAVK